MGIIFGTESEFLSAGSIGDVAMVALDASTFVVAYKDDANSAHGTAKIGTISGSTITFGDPKQFKVSLGAFEIALAALDSTKFVVAYRDLADGGHGTAKIGTVSGTTINFGSEKEFASIGTTTDIAVAALTTSKFVVVYRDIFDSSHGKARIGTVSGTTITYGTAVKYLSTASATENDVAALDDGMFVVVYRDNGDSSHGTSRVGTVSGTTITFFGETEFLSSGSALFNRVTAIDDITFIVAYKDGADSNHGTARIGQITGGTITYGAEKEFLSTGAASVIDVASFSPSKFVVTYQDGSDSAHGKAKVGTIVDTTITFSDETEYLFASANYNPIALLDESKFVVAYQDGGDSNHGTARMGQITPIITTASGDLFIQGLDVVDTSGDLSIHGHLDSLASGDLLIQGHLNSIASGDLSIHGHTDSISSGNLFIDGHLDSLASGNLFTHGHTDSIASGNLFIHGHTDSISSGNLFIDGHLDSFASGNLFIQGHINAIASGDLFIHGHLDSIASGDLFIHGHVDSFASGNLFIHGDDDFVISGALFIRGHDDGTARSLDWLLRTHDHFPQIIGTFETLVSAVTIQVWDVTDGQNILVSLSDSDCYAIGNTGRWGWSTSDLPSAQGRTRHYFYLMTSNTGREFDGQFLMDSPEGAKWIHPNSQNDYIIRL